MTPSLIALTELLKTVTPRVSFSQDPGHRVSFLEVVYYESMKRKLI
jgi:hypothetical protein